MNFAKMSKKDQHKTIDDMFAGEMARIMGEKKPENDKSRVLRRLGNMMNRQGAIGA